MADRPDNPPPPDDRPEDLLFQSNLQEFARKVGFAVGLEQGDKINSAEAYMRIRTLWKDLKHSHRALLSEEEAERLDRGGDLPADGDG
ncbi:MAG: hypothetical protein AAGK09_07065 [Planctomycetota bacterium]